MIRWAQAHLLATGTLAFILFVAGCYGLLAYVLLRKSIR